MRISSLPGRTGPWALQFGSLSRRPWLRSTRALSSQASNDSNSDSYNLPALTQKWEPFWARHRVWTKPREDRGQAYILPMFPYPSGTLHMGHLRVYTISDVLARVKRMTGHRVIHPIGWDAFGLPAENAARERGVHPSEWTDLNIQAMKKQIQAMGGQWDWKREFKTSDPAYYKHTQYLFLQLLKRDLAYRAEAEVNWDPVDQTVLANEQVDANGCSWRSGAKVERKRLKQWFLGITRYQHLLHDDLDELVDNGDWPEKVAAMQKNWLGKSTSHMVDFKILDSSKSQAVKRRDRKAPQRANASVFTTRLDTLPGVQYVAVSLSHPLTKKFAGDDAALRDFIKRAETSPHDSKEGYELTRVKARNPLTDELLPVFVAPYVLGDYGSGAVMGVPGHDARDHAFWRQNRSAEPIKCVVTPDPGQSDARADLKEKPFLGKGYVVSTDSRINGLASDEAIATISTLLREMKKGRPETIWRLKDWLVSRQRYWGTPIPIVYCKSCGTVPVPAEDLPVLLPERPASYFAGKHGNPLEHDREWKKTDCPVCQGPARRETDTMDTFMDSSWYFWRFLDPKNNNYPFNRGILKKDIPVDVYVGGIEHAILHLLYARFITKFIAEDTTWIKVQKQYGVRIKEPFKRLVTQGMVHGKTYSDPATGRFLRPEEVDLTSGKDPLIKDTGLPAKVSYEKMSKSKYNGVDPTEVIKQYGADVTRTHMLFQAPIGDVLEWDETKITGAERWLKRVLKLSTAFWCPEDQTTMRNFVPPSAVDEPMLWFEKCQEAGMLPATTEANYKSMLDQLHPEELHLLAKTQTTIASVDTSYLKSYSLNTVVSDLMTLTNAIYDTPHVSDVTPVIRYMSMTSLLRMVAPIAPAVAEEGWHVLHPKFNHKIRDDEKHSLRRYNESGQGPSVFTFGLPKPDFETLLASTVNITTVVQVNGKKKFDAKIPKFVPESVTSPQDKEDDSANTTESQVKKAPASYIISQLLETDQGKQWFDKEATGGIWGIAEASGTQEIVQEPGELHQEFPDAVPPGWQVYVVGDGKLVNFVTPKKAKPEKRQV